MLNSLVQDFDFNGSGVRVVLREGEPWFVGADVCSALSHSNARVALSRLDDDEKGVSNVDTLGGEQKMTVINESGVYHFVLTSRTPQAQPFRRWVTHDVLPTLRREGAYQLTGVAPAGQRVDRVNAIVNAGRIFTTINKVARASGVAKKQAADLANAAGVRETGVDLFEVGQIERHVPDVPPGVNLPADPWYEALAEWAEGQTAIAPSHALTYLQGVKRKQSHSDLTRVGHILCQLGFTCVTRRRERGGMQRYRYKPGTSVTNETKSTAPVLA